MHELSFVRGIGRLLVVLRTAVVGLIGLKLQRDTVGLLHILRILLPLLLPIIQRRHRDFRVFRVGVMHHFRVVPQRPLYEPLRVGQPFDLQKAVLGPLRSSIRTTLLSTDDQLLVEESEEAVHGSIGKRCVQS